MRRNPVIDTHPDLLTGFGDTGLHVPLHELNDSELAEYVVSVGLYHVPMDEWDACTEEQQQVMTEAWEPVCEELQESLKKEINERGQRAEQYAQDDGATYYMESMHEQLGEEARRAIANRIKGRGAYGELDNILEDYDKDFVEENRSEIEDILSDSNNYEEVVGSNHGTVVLSDLEGEEEFLVNELDEDYARLGPDELDVRTGLDEKRFYEALHPKAKRWSPKVYLHYSMPDYALQVKDADVRAAIDGLKDEDVEEEGPTTKGEDNVVFEGPDGFYVADLRPGQLALEGKTLGHCVGSHGYPQAVANGEIKIFSVRAANGRPKLTIEAEIEASESDPKGYVVDRVVQVKGKGNRLAEKPSEVMLVADFLESIGAVPEEARDLQPGLKLLPAAFPKQLPRAQRALPEPPRENPRVSPVAFVDKEAVKYGWHCSWCREP